MLILLYKHIFTQVAVSIYLQTMISITPKEVSTAKLHGYLLSAVSPRPIAFASTMDKDGNVILLLSSTHSTNLANSFNF